MSATIPNFEYNAILRKINNHKSELNDYEHKARADGNYSFSHDMHIRIKECELILKMISEVHVRYQ